MSRIASTFRRLLREEGGWTRVLTPLAIAICLGAGITLFQRGAPSPPAYGWLLTTSNIGLGRFGLDCDTLPTYTTNPVPADTHIYRRRIVFDGSLDLNNGGITIEQSCIQPTGADAERIVESYTPPSPNVIEDSEIDGSLLGQQEAAFACAFRGIASIYRTYIHDIGSGICIVSYDETITFDSTIQNNIIRLLRGFGDAAGSGSHNEAATTRCFRTDLNPSRRMTWDGNWIETYSTGGTGGDGANDSAGLFIQAIQCPIGNVYIKNNYITDPGNWVIYSDENGSTFTDSATFELTNNRFGPWGFGPCAIAGFTFDTQTDNFAYDSGNPPDYDGATVTC